MQPITYSLIINVLILAVVGALTYVFSQPLLIVVGLMMMNHVMERFSSKNDEDEEDDSQPMGFTADVVGK